jgi:hypothetical protein
LLYIGTAINDYYEICKKAFMNLSHSVAEIPIVLVLRGAFKW